MNFKRERYFMQAFLIEKYSLFLLLWTIWKIFFLQRDLVEKVFSSQVPSKVKGYQWSSEKWNVRQNRLEKFQKNITIEFLSNFFPLSLFSVYLRFVLKNFETKITLKNRKKKQEKFFKGANNKRRQLSLPKNGIKLSLKTKARRW